MSSIPAQDVDSGQPLIFRQFTILFPKESLQMCFIEMWTGAMWTSQILVKTQRHPNQGLVGSGPVRHVPIRRKNHLNHLNHRNQRNHQRKMEEQVTLRKLF